MENFLEKILSDLKTDLEKSINFFKEDIATIRTFRATPRLVEDILIDYYGQKLKLKQLASITAPQNNILIIQPWDKNAVEAIVKNDNFIKMGFNPIVDKEVIKIILPPLTQERKQTLIKLIHQKAEKARISLRLHRETALKELKKIKEGISEDEKFRTKDKIQNFIDDFNKKINEIVEAKERELNQ